MKKGRSCRAMKGYVGVLAAAMLVAPGAASGQVTGPELPANDLEAAIPGGQVVSSGPAQLIAHPTLAPAPKATCGAGSHPLNDPIQGRVSQADLADPQAEQGWTCNVTRVGHFPTPGGFRVWRYVDRNDHVCAFYDSSLGS